MYIIKHYIGLLQYAKIAVFQCKLIYDAFPLITFHVNICVYKYENLYVSIEKN